MRIEIPTKEANYPKFVKKSKNIIFDMMVLYD